MMLELSDAWLAMPGGFGTLDEFFDALCLLQIRNHSKPCGMLNIRGFYDPLLAFIENARVCGMLKTRDRELINVHATPEGLLDLLEEKVESPGLHFLHSASWNEPEMCAV